MANVDVHLQVRGGEAGYEIRGNGQDRLRFDHFRAFSSARNGSLNEAATKKGRKGSRYPKQDWKKRGSRSNSARKERDEKRDG